MGSLTQGSTGQCSGALIGSGVSSATDYLNTGWAPNLANGTSWTIAFWSSGIGGNSTLYYIFGDAGSSSFRCFTNGVAGANNWMMRGGGLTDIPLPGGAISTPTLNAFVYDHTTNVVKAYLNGVLVSTVAQNTPNIVGPGPFKVMGYSSSYGAPSGGKLDEFRVYSRALTEQELLDLFNTNVTGTDTRTECTSYTWIDGNTYTSSNNSATYTIPAGGSNNCDSIVTLNLTIVNPGTSTDVQTACNSYTWIDGNTYTSSNNSASYVYPGAAANGCDSIVNLDLTITLPATGTSVQTACNSFTWIDGNTYTSSNNSATYTYSGGAANGCDSIVTLDLTINQPATGVDIQSACNAYTWIDGNTYTSSNNTATFTLVGAAANGCDSIVTLDLTINQPATGVDVQSACNAYTWIDGNTYTSSNNTATYTLSGASVNGCDSIISLDLTINQPVTGTDVQSACNAYTWINGNTYTSSNNTAVYTLTGASTNGCDSIVTLDLTINSVDTSITLNNSTLTSNQSGGLYQWVHCSTGITPISGANSASFTPTISGDYAVQVTVNGCTDISACYTVVISRVEYTDAASQLQVYPNPTSDNLNIVIDQQHQNATIQLFSVNGSLITEKRNPTGNVIELSLQELPAAMYFLKVITNNATYEMKVSKL
ncbi:MAG: T9SS type A sorting domain-containing protein [Bacteroidota bacterium]|nr:T9SS type A sorting domain-containing protein [Bacteroidota bacterium]